MAFGVSVIYRVGVFESFAQLFTMLKISSQLNNFEIVFLGISDYREEGGQADSP
jgi:hypothetical protein